MNESPGELAAKKATKRLNKWKYRKARPGDGYIASFVFWKEEDAIEYIRLLEEKFPRQSIGQDILPNPTNYGWVARFAIKARGSDEFFFRQ